MTQAWFLLISTILVDTRAILVKTLMAGCSFRWNLNYFSGNVKCISAQSSLHCISPIVLANLLSLPCCSSAVIDVFFWLYLVLFYKNSIFKTNFVSWRDFSIWREYFSRALCHWSALLQLCIILYWCIKDVTVMRWFQSSCVVLMWWF